MVGEAALLSSTPNGNRLISFYHSTCIRVVGFLGLQWASNPHSQFLGLVYMCHSSDALMSQATLGLMAGTEHLAQCRMITARGVPQREVSSDDFISSPDLEELFKDVHEVAPKWQNFGVHLKVPYSRIQGFSGGDGMVERCFTTMLATWLEGETTPTVDRLVSGLQMPGVDQRVLALDIDKNRQGEHKSRWSEVMQYQITCMFSLVLEPPCMH